MSSPSRPRYPSSSPCRMPLSSHSPPAHGLTPSPASAIVPTGTLASSESATPTSCMRFSSANATRGYTPNLATSFQIPSQLTTAPAVQFNRSYPPCCRTADKILFVRPLVTDSPYAPPTAPLRDPPSAPLSWWVAWISASGATGTNYLVGSL